MNMKNWLLTLFLISMITGCGDTGSTRFRPSDITGVSGLDSDVFKRFQDTIDTDSPSTLYPNSLTEFHKSVSYKNSQAFDYTIEFESQMINCRFSYTEAVEEVRFQKEVVTSPDDSEQDNQETVSYKTQTTVIPTEPTYTSIPYIAAREEACRDQIDLLNQTSAWTEINLMAQYKSFKTLVNQQITDVLSICDRGARINGMKCLGAKITNEQFSEANPIDTYAFTIEYMWLKNNGEQMNTTLDFEVAPSLFYFPTLGFLNFKGSWPNPSSEISFKWKNISTLKLSGL